jgi:hypothetical protein
MYLYLHLSIHLHVDAQHERVASRCVSLCANMYMRHSMYMYAVRVESMQVCVCVRVRVCAQRRASAPLDLYDYVLIFVDV